VQGQQPLLHDFPFISHGSKLAAVIKVLLAPTQRCAEYQSSVENVALGNDNWK
jgi:hypothetical protein